MTDERPAYLRDNEAFYASFWKETAHYGSRFPNAEEAARAGCILELLGIIAERQRWDLNPPRLLDAGCGRGWLTNLLSNYGKADGCEPTTAAVNLARDLFPTLTFHPMTPGEFRRSPGFVPYDVVVSSEVIEHVPSGLQRAFVQDLHDCLVPGGFAIVTTPRRERWSDDAASTQLIENWLTERELERHLRGAGFTVIALRRAVPIGGGALQRWRSRIRRWRATATDRPTALGRAFDWHRCLYQVWWVQREPR